MKEIITTLPTAFHSFQRRGPFEKLRSIPHYLGNVITSSSCAGKYFLGVGAHVAKPGVYVFDKIKFGLGW